MFLSKRRGALLVRLELTDTLRTLAVGGLLSYQTPTGETIEDTLEATFAADVNAQGQAYAQPSVAKTVALAILVSSMKEVAERYADAPDAALTLMQEAVTRFTADIEGLGDASLGDEAEFAGALLTLMQKGAPQGTLYGDL